MTFGLRPKKRVRESVCQREGCEEVVKSEGVGQPKRYCSPKCRWAAQRERSFWLKINRIREELGE